MGGLEHHESGLDPKGHAETLDVQAGDRLARLSFSIAPLAAT